MQTETEKKIKMIVLIIIAVALFTLAYGIILYAQANTNKEAKMPEKIQQELSYLDKNFIAMLHSLNNIVYEPYKVKTEQSTQNKTSSQTQSQEEEGNSKEQSGKQEESSGEEESEDQSEDQSSSENKTNETQESKMEEAGILNIDTHSIDWTTLKQQIEILYASWNTIAIDLHSLNVNQESILQFNTTMQQTIQAIKAEDKTQTLLTLANLYALLPQYAEGALENKETTQMYQTKSGVIHAYALLEQEKWDEMKTQIVAAQEIFANRLNQVNDSSTIQAMMHKIYMHLKEMETVCDGKDRDLFLMNYKEIMQLLETVEE